MSILKTELASFLLQTGSFKFDPKKKFKLSSGDYSDFYVDCKTLMAYPSAHSMVAQLSLELLKGIPFTHIGGLEIGAIPIAIVISTYHYLEEKQEWPIFVVRKLPKEHGLEKRIEGPVRQGDQALIVDDVLTSGGSVIQAVRAARAEGLKVNHALVIVDREEQDGRKRVEREGVSLISLLTKTEIQNLANLALVNR